MKLGVQLFTVRKEANKDLYKTLYNLSQIGVRYIEAARIDFNEENANIFKKASENLGTQVISTQIKYHTLQDSFREIVRFHKITGCKYAIISVLPTENIIGNNKQLIEFCLKTNELADRYMDQGITLCFHHHDYEFIKRNEGIQFDILRENLESNVFFIIDTYWATKGGFAPDKLIESLRGRVAGVHLRDFALSGVRKKARDFALGDGVIDFSSIMRICEEQNVEYGAIEQKTKQPLQELQKSVKHLIEIGYKDYF